MQEDRIRFRFRALLMAAMCAFGLAGPYAGHAADPSPAAAPKEQREPIKLEDAVFRALKNNLDITISRQTKESRLADIMIEQAKFDPTLSLNGTYTRTVNPLNRPVFGGTVGNLTDIQTFDQRNTAVTLDVTSNLMTGGNIDLNYSPQRTNVNADVLITRLVNPWTAIYFGYNSNFRNREIIDALSGATTFRPTDRLLNDGWQLFAKWSQLLRW